MPIPTKTRLSSIALILLAWTTLQLGGLFTPGLLDDVDSIYLQIAREMLQRHDYVTPYIDGIRFFDKPPLMYWMAAASMRLFGVHDWAGRLPLALGVLALLFATYALANYLFRPSASCSTSYFLLPASCPSDRPGLYAALILATSIGTYLYTRFYIPDILIALWMTLSVHLFLLAIDRIEARTEVERGYNQALSLDGDARVPQGFSLGSHISPKETEARVPQGFSLGSHGPAEIGALAPGERSSKSPLPPILAFSAVLALDLLTKGLIGIIFPLAFVLLYLALTGRLRLLTKLHLPAATLVFAAIALPWHILIWLRNPAISMPTGVGLPAKAGWAWFYLYNEHIARALSRRIPHDYGNVPRALFWLLLVLWLVPWAAFLPAALRNAFSNTFSRHDNNLGAPFMTRFVRHQRDAQATKAPLTLLLWAFIILGFFTVAARQEYYHLPALPALAILVAGLLTAADNPLSSERRQALYGSLYGLVPLGTLLALVTAWFGLTAPTPAPGVTLDALLSTNPDMYNLSLGHVFDLTGQAMGFFRAPLLLVALGMLTLGPLQHLLLRRRGKTFAANLVVALGMTCVLTAAHQGLVRFYPILGSKDLAQQVSAQIRPGDLLVIDGELTAGSTLLFYTDQCAKPCSSDTKTTPNQRQQAVYLVNGHVNGPWFGSFWPDSPHLFLTGQTLQNQWSGPHRVFLLTYHPTQRTADLAPYAPVHDFAHSGGKTILTNR